MPTFSDALMTLARHCVDTGVDGLPDAVRRRAVRVLADDLGAMATAGSEPELRAATRQAVERGARPEATIIQPGLPRVATEDALLINAMAGCWCELDEGYRPVTCHAGLYVLPALLAEAERQALSFDEVLRILALGYEICARIAECFRFPTPRVHAHALFSPIGAAAVTMLARGASAEDLARGIASAATLASIGPRTHLAKGYLTRNLWAGGAVAGWQAARMVPFGIFPGLEAPMNVFSDILGGAGNASALTDGLGENYSILAGYHKLYACCQHGHSVVEAALTCATHFDFDLDDIAGIEVQSHPLALGLSNTAPETILGAKFSVEHMAAAALVYLEGGQAAFSTASLNDPAVARLRPLVTITAYPPPEDPKLDRASRVIVTMTDGRIFGETCLDSIGSPDRPLDDAAFAVKLDTMGEDVLPGLAHLAQTDGADLLGLDWIDALARIAQNSEFIGGAGHRDILE